MPFDSFRVSKSKKSSTKRIVLKIQSFTARCLRKKCDSSRLSNTSSRLSSHNFRSVHSKPVNKNSVIRFSKPRTFDKTLLQYNERITTGQRNKKPIRNRNSCMFTSKNIKNHTCNTVDVATDAFRSRHKRDKLLKLIKQWITIQSVPQLGRS